jgi:acetyl-CoA carboxylase biotin carboxyl carrier protein
MSQILSDIAGVVIQILVAEGDSIAGGTEVITLESMKMEHPIESAVSGRVAKILVAEGDFVEEGQAVLEVE